MTLTVCLECGGKFSTSADVCTHCGIAANRSNVIEFGEFHTCEHCQGEGSCTKQSVLGALLGYSCNDLP